MFELLIGLPLVLFLPGWTLVNVLFPKKGELDREYDTLYRLTLGIVMSIVIVVLLGFVLNASSPPSGLGYFTATNLWVGLTGLTVALFALGWWRGAYPFLARLHPALKRPMPRDSASILADLDVDRAVLAKFRELAAERERLRRQVKDADRRVTLHAGTMKAHYENRRRELQEELHKVDVALHRLEEERAAELY